MTERDRVVTGGVDTHKDVHVAAFVDAVGHILSTAAFPATAPGYRRLVAWLGGFGRVDRVGVEGTGSYGAGLARHLVDEEIEVVEVNRPNRQARRRRGKSDTADAEAAARAALNGEAAGTSKAHDGLVESIRALRVAFTSLRDTRTRVGNQIRDLVVTAPNELSRRPRAARPPQGALSVAPGSGPDRSPFMQDDDGGVTGGVDTPGDEHVAAVIDDAGWMLGTAAFPANAVGFRRLLIWLRRHGQLARSAWSARAPTAPVWPAT